MSVTVSDAQAREWARRLERKEAERHGIPLLDARRRVARRLGTSPGTLENLSRGRLKGVREWLYSKLLSTLISQVEREMAALSHEHETLLALGKGRDDRAVQEVVAGLERLRGLLSEGVAR